MSVRANVSRRFYFPRAAVLSWAAPPPCCGAPPPRPPAGGRWRAASRTPAPPHPALRRRSLGDRARDEPSRSLYNLPGGLWVKFVYLCPGPLAAPAGPRCPRAAAVSPPAPGRTAARWRPWPWRRWRGRHCPRPRPRPPGDSR